jgi:MerR family transcriptional regulator/heat shock protein HspR
MELNKNNEPVYTLSVTSRLSGIPAHSIRQYIDKGLLIPLKLESNRHLFSQGDVQRLKMIHSLIREKGLNISGIRALMATIPCWAIRPCKASERKSCGAYYENSVPCWEASDKHRTCMNTDCRECIVYESLCRNGDVKSLIRNLL